MVQFSSHEEYLKEWLKQDAETKKCSLTGYGARRLYDLLKRTRKI